MGGLVGNTSKLHPIFLTQKSLFFIPVLHPTSREILFHEGKFVNFRDLPS